MSVTSKHIVIIWGVDDFNTLGLLRELGQAHLKVLFIIYGKAKIAAHSKYCTYYIQTKSITEGYTRLLSNFSNCNNKPVIITSGDDIAVFIDQHRTELETYFILPGTAKQGGVQLYTDKNIQTKLAESIGIPCPKSYYIKQNSPIPDIEYPCIIKPAHEKEGHYNEFKFKVCYNREMLQQTLKLVREDSEFILQEYINTDGVFLVYGARLQNGNTILAGVLLKDRFADDGSGTHGYLTKDIPNCIDTKKIIRFVEHIDFYGPFSFEYGKKGGEAYFFEMNLRNDGTSHYFYQAGANIPLAYVYSQMNIDYSKVSTFIRNSTFIDEIYDIENVIHGRISFRQWKEEKRNATVFRYYSLEDQKPWLVERRKSWLKIIQDILLKNFRIYIVAVLDKIGFQK